LVTRKTEHHEVILRVGVPESFELLKLWSESTLGGSIDDEEDFSSIFREGYLFMIRFSYPDVVERCVHR
jgi:hypothetical protein